jgi:hypothetical protein
MNDELIPTDLELIVLKRSSIEARLNFNLAQKRYLRAVLDRKASDDLRIKAEACLLRVRAYESALRKFRSHLLDAKQTEGMKVELALSKIALRSLDRYQLTYARLIAEHARQANYEKRACPWLTSPLNDPKYG